MSEVLLSRSEFVFLLHTIHTQAVIGIASDTLFPREPAHYQQLVVDGEERLLRRGLLLVGSNGARMIEATLCAMVTVVARPDLAAIAVRHAAGAGRQIFLLYQSANLTVEQTFPREGEHRLALLGNPTALVERLQVVLPLRASVAVTDAGEVPQDAFFEIKRLADAGQWQQAWPLLQTSGFSQMSAGAFLRAMEHPELDGTIAFMRCQGNTITDARNVAIVCGAEQAWAIHQRVPGVPMLNIEAIEASTMRRLIVRYRDEMMVAA